MEKFSSKKQMDFVHTHYDYHLLAAHPTQLCSRAVHRIERWHQSVLHPFLKHLRVHHLVICHTGIADQTTLHLTQRKWGKCG
jgi:hypothetical protein